MEYLNKEGREYISTKEAAELFGYTSDYIGQLSRSGIIKSVIVGKTKFVEKNGLLKYIETTKNNKLLHKNGDENAETVGSQNQEISKSKSTYESINNENKINYSNEEFSLLPKLNKKSLTPVSENNESLIKSPFLPHENFVSDAFFKKIISACFAVVVVFGPYTFLRTPYAEAGWNKIKSVADGSLEIGKEIAQKINRDGIIILLTDSLAYSKDLLQNETRKIAVNTASTILSTDIQSSQFSLKNIAKEIYLSISSLFTKTKTTGTTQLVENAEINPSVQTGKTPTPTPTTVQTQQPTKTIVIEGPTKIIERVLEKTSTVGVSKEELEARIQQLDNKLSSKIYNVSSGTPNSVQSVYNVVSQTNRIDKLTNVDITTPTIVGGTLKDIVISNSSFSGSTIGGSSLDLTGNATIGGQLTVSGTATSTIAGDVNFDSNTLFVDSINNRVGIGTTTPQYALDVVGALNVSSIVISAGETVGGNFDVTGNTNLGNATTSDKTYFNSRIGTSLVPTVDNILDLGDNTNWLRWKSGLFGTSVGIGGMSTSTASSLLSSGVYTIDSSNGILFNTINNASTTFGTGLVTLPNFSSTNGTTTNSTSTNLYSSKLVAENATTTSFFTSVFNAITSVFSSLTSGTATIGSLTATSSATLSYTGADMLITTDSAGKLVSSSTPQVASITATSTTATSTFAGGLAVETNGLVYDYSSNNVGIGTASPSYKLDVNGIVNATSLYVNGSPYIGSQWTTLDSNIYYNTGNVGIGTTTPYAKLSVEGDSALGNSALAGYFIATSTTATSTFAGFIDVNGTGANATSTIASNLWVKGTLRTGTGSLYMNDTALTASNGGFQINSTATSTFSTNGLAIGTDQFVVQQTSGRVGIGTASPSYKLSILDTTSGNVRANIQGGTTSGYSIFNVANTSATSNLSMLALGSAAAGNAFGTAQAGSLQISSTGGVMMVGTADAQPLILGTNNAESMRILSGGNVGIGTTTPGNILDIQRAAADTRLLITESSDNGLESVGLTLRRSRGTSLSSPTAIQAGNYMGSINFQGYGTSYATGAQIQALAVETWSATARGTDLSFWTVDKTTTTLDERMRISDNGNVGIGTTTPGSLLSLGDTGDNTINISATATSTFGSGINLRTGCFSVNGVCVGGASSQWTTTGSNISYSTGNIGIGTTTPNNKLSIYDTSKSAIEFSGASGDTYKWTMGMDVANGGRFSIASSTALGTTDRLIILGNGNIGIATTTATEALTLQGNFKINDFTFKSLSTTEMTLYDSANNQIITFDQGTTASVDPIWGQSTRDEFLLGTFFRTFLTSDDTVALDEKSAGVLYSDGSFMSTVNEFEFLENFQKFTVETKIPTGTSMTAIIESSDDNFATVKSSLDIPLKDGLNNYDAWALKDGKYFRATFNFNTTDISISPELISFETQGIISEEVIVTQPSSSPIAESAPVELTAPSGFVPEVLFPPMGVYPAPIETIISPDSITIDNLMLPLNTADPNSTLPNVLGTDSSVVISSSGVVEDFLAQLKNIASIANDTVTGLPKLIISTILEVKQLIADKIMANTAQVGQLEMIDKATGEAYCTWIENGEWIKEKGKCDETPTSVPSSGSSGTNAGDIVPPVITLIGSNPAEIIKGTSFIDPGATATDNITTDIVPDMIENTVNTSLVGEYKVVWTAHDSALNYSTTTRRVMVVDPVAPASTPVTEPASTTPTI